MKNIEEKGKLLISELPTLIKEFNVWGYRRGPDLYFYKKTLSEVRKNKLENLFENEKFIELIYSTLISWDMNARGAKMKYFDDFLKNIKENKNEFIELSKFKLNELSEDELTTVKTKLSSLYDKMELMTSTGRLVSNSKTMHFILPDLVMPMDRGNTLLFFYGNTGESKEKFLQIFECSWNIAKKLNLTLYLDAEWNQSIPKIIDNAILKFAKK